eukprot:scaffold32044_cov30-Tisochrysis_lutea.AAC.3
MFLPHAQLLGSNCVSTPPAPSALPLLPPCRTSVPSPLVRNLGAWGSEGQVGEARPPLAYSAALDDRVPAAFICVARRPGTRTPTPVPISLRGVSAERLHHRDFSPLDQPHLATVQSQGGCTLWSAICAHPPLSPSSLASRHNEFGQGNQHHRPAQETDAQ